MNYIEEQGVQYPQSAVFVKSAKGDNGKWIDEFAKKNPIGSHVDVDFSDRKSTRLNSSHSAKSRMPSSA